MGLFRETPGTIHVTFVDSATGRPFAESHVPAAQLPESFEASTTLHLGDQDWSVVEARPVTSAEFRRSGKLLLILSKITTGFVDPSTLLFSLPTITGDALPPIAAGTSKLGVNTIEIHEDVWRQIEWLPASTAGVVESELQFVRNIYENERRGEAFETCHVRKSIPTQLQDCAIRLGDMQAALGDRATWLAGFSYEGIAGIVANSFSCRLLSSIELFGVASNDVIEAVCFANSRANNLPGPDIQNLVRFAADHDLLLVDWCAVFTAVPTVTEYMAYFNRH